MELGKVVGTVVATVKDRKLEGRKLLLVGLVDPELQPIKSHLIAVDTVGAGVGELVIVVRGSSARQAKNMDVVPTDTSIIGIIDALELEGRLVYQKYPPK